MKVRGLLFTDHPV